jgi:hypothetical protein
MKENSLKETCLAREAITTWKIGRDIEVCGRMDEKKEKVYIILKTTPNTKDNSSRTNNTERAPFIMKMVKSTRVIGRTTKEAAL